MFFFQLDEIAPIFFYDTIYLIKLFLNNNSIEVLYSYMFVKATTIERLILADNQIHIVERRAFTGLMALKKLELNNNKIIEMDLTELPPMCTIYLTKNKIQKFRNLHGLPMERQRSPRYRINILGNRI